MKQTNISSKFRNFYGLTMQELADLCGKSRSSIMNWEYNNSCPAAVKFILSNIMSQGLTSEQMLIRMKEAFDT